MEQERWQMPYSFVNSIFVHHEGGQDLSFGQISHFLKKTSCTAVLDLTKMLLKNTIKKCRPQL